jgi:predicted NBD/HSP70 family sugar kinase
VGVGLAGFVDALSGKLRYSPIFGWRDVPLVSLLQERLHVPISIDNDVNTLTLTELLFGTGQGISNFFTVTIGRGVGMGVVVNGQLYRGATGWAGEFGHIVIDPDGPACACGKSGCLETYISDPALVRLAREAVAKGNLHASIQTVNDLVAAAERGERAAREILAAAGEKLGVAISNLVNVFNPALIIISGEGVRAGDCLFSPMHAAIELNVVPGFIEDVEIKIDVWDDDAWARGAASLVLLDLFTSPFYPQVMARTTAS